MTVVRQIQIQLKSSESLLDDAVKQHTFAQIRYSSKLAKLRQKRNLQMIEGAQQLIKSAKRLGVQAPFPFAPS